MPALPPLSSPQSISPASAVVAEAVAVVFASAAAAESSPQSISAASGSGSAALPFDVVADEEVFADAVPSSGGSSRPLRGVGGKGGGLEIG